MGIRAHKRRMIHGSRQRRALRHRLAEAQNWRCCYCGGECDFLSATIEHVQPLAFGGRDDWFNLAMACKGCNEMRGRPITDFLQGSRARSRR